LLAGCGADIIPVYTSAGGVMDIRPVLAALAGRGIRTLLVDGDSHLISTLLKQNLVSYCVITIAPRFTGGESSIDGSRSLGEAPLTITDCRYQPLGADIIAFGPVHYG
jgi:3,4-dihydroxy 2-butanone 4-phosphate synthase/GTP cyclohydrolase II